MKPPKIIFMGTPEFACPSLRALIRNGYRILAVVTGPDKPVGRHAYRQAGEQKLTPSPVKKIALKYKLPLLQPNKISEIFSRLSFFKPDLMIVVAYGQILPKEILDIPQYGCLNIHPSLLPKYRGPSPIQFALLNGEKETGVTLMLMNEKIDQGPILAQSRTEIKPNETFGLLEKRLAQRGAQLLIKILPLYIPELKTGLANWSSEATHPSFSKKNLGGELRAKNRGALLRYSKNYRRLKSATPRSQKESQATYTKILTRQDGQIFWNQTAEEIERQIRAFDPWPSSYTGISLTASQPKRLKILKGRVISCPGSKRNYGEVFLGENGEMLVQTGDGCLVLEKVQLEGGKPISGQEFLRGHKNIIGAILK